MLGYCNLCWIKGEFPTEWRWARVVGIFKKGSASDPANGAAASPGPDGLPYHARTRSTYSFVCVVLDVYVAHP